MIVAHLIQTASSLPADISALESAISALESAINARDSSSGLWETLAWVFTGAVVVGVAIEVCVIVLEHRDAMTAWRRGVVRPPDRPSYPLFMWGLIGSILVALGVAGEFGVGIEIALINGELRTKNAELRSKSEQLVALVTQEAGDAKLSAASAEASAKAADIAAGKAQDKVKAVARQAEGIDADLARTQYLLSGRSVTNFDSLVGQLRRYNNRVVHIGSTSVIEQNLLCAALYKAAHDAEINAFNECGRLELVGAMPTGVVISGPNLQETLDIAQILLHTSDLGPGGTQSGTFSPELRIVVGAEPPFMATQARGVKTPKKQQTSKAKTKP